jgi:hypothetical protein
MGTGRGLHRAASDLRSDPWWDSIRSMLLAHVRRAQIDQRTRSWARRLTSESEIPEAYRAFFAALPRREGRLFPYTVLTPTFKGGPGRAEPERLLCLTGQALHVFTQDETHPSPICYPLDDIFYVERGVMLLYSWIGFYGRSLDSATSSTTIRFNSVTDHILAPFVEQLRPPGGSPPASPPGSKTFSLDDLARANFKFMSYAHASLRAGDVLRLLIYQPQVRRRPARFLGLARGKPIAAAHLVMLTRRELILIRDDDTQRPTRGSPHGAIWKYVPLAKIVSASMGAGAGGSIGLHIELSPDVHIDAEFESSRSEAVEQLLGSLPHHRSARSAVPAVP